MRIVVFGLSVSSAWGNGHATIWRSLAVALDKAGHELVFFEQDTPYYAAHRDALTLRGCNLVLYGAWEDVEPRATRELARADAAVVTSYCPDAARAAELILSSRVPVRAYYDMDTPVTLDRLEAGEPVFYLPEYGLGDFDVVLSFTGGAALEALRHRLGARRTVPLYGSVDVDAYRRVAPVERFRADLSYLGTFAEDRRRATEELFVGPATLCPRRTFLLAGALYPEDFPWRSNIIHREHVAPFDHPELYSSCRLTLNLTRATMARYGYCPSERLFEAAACGAPIVSDVWPGLEAFFAPGDEILVAKGAQDVVAALESSDEELLAIAENARQRTLSQHTSDVRARELVVALTDPALAGAEQAAPRERDATNGKYA